MACSLKPSGRPRQLIEKMFYQQDDFQEKESDTKTSFKIFKQILEYSIIFSFLCRVGQERQPEPISMIYDNHRNRAKLSAETATAAASTTLIRRTNIKGKQTEADSAKVIKAVGNNDDNNKNGEPPKQSHQIFTLKFIGFLNNHDNQTVRWFLTFLEFAFLIYVLIIGIKFMAISALNHARSRLLINLKLELRPVGAGGSQVLFLPSAIANMTKMLGKTQPNCVRKQDLILFGGWQAHWQEQLRKLNLVGQMLDSLGDPAYTSKEAEPVLYWLLGSLPFVYLLAGIIFVSKGAVRYDSLNFILDPTAERSRIRQELETIITGMIAVANKFKRARVEAMPNSSTLSNGSRQPAAGVFGGSSDFLQTPIIQANSDQNESGVLRQQYQFKPQRTGKRRRNSAWGVSEAFEADLLSIGKGDSPLSGTTIRRGSQMRRISEVSPPGSEQLLLFDGQLRINNINLSSNSSRLSSNGKINPEVASMGGDKKQHVRRRMRSRDYTESSPNLTKAASYKHDMSQYNTAACKDGASFVNTLFKIDYLDLVRPANLTQSWHRRSTIQHIAIYTFCEVVGVIGAFSTLGICLVTEYYLRAKYRYEKIQCEHLVPNGTLIWDSMRLGRLESSEDSDSYLRIDGNFKSLLELAFKIEGRIWIETSKNQLFLLEAFTLITLGVGWATFYVVAFVQNNNDKVRWLNQIKGQLDCCVERLSARRRAIPQDEDQSFRQEVDFENVYDSDDDDEGDSSDTICADSSTIDEEFDITSNNKNGKQHVNCGSQIVGAAKREMDGDAELLKIVTITYLNFELFRRQHKSYKVFTNFLIIQTTFCVVQTLLLTHLSTSSNGINHNLLLFGGTFMLLWCNIYLLSGTRVTNEIGKVMVRIMRLLASGAQVSPPLAYLIGLWRRQILDDQSTRELFAPSLFDTYLSYQKLIEFNAYLIAFYLMLIK